MIEFQVVSNVPRLRKQRNLTQLELALQVGVTETTIANWERGRKGLEAIEKVIRLCEILHCQPEELIELKKSPALNAPPIQLSGSLRGILREKPKLQSNIAVLRKRNHLTQLDLALQLGVTETTIANWERDRKGLESFEKLIRLCNVLQCKLEDLIQRSPVDDSEAGSDRTSPGSQISPKLDYCNQEISTSSPPSVSSDPTYSCNRS